MASVAERDKRQKLHRNLEAFAKSRSLPMPAWWKHYSEQVQGMDDDGELGRARKQEMQPAHETRFDYWDDGHAGAALLRHRQSHPTKATCALFAVAAQPECEAALATLRSLPRCTPLAVVNIGSGFRGARQPSALRSLLWEGGAPVLVYFPPLNPAKPAANENEQKDRGECDSERGSHGIAPKTALSASNNAVDQCTRGNAGDEEDGGNNEEPCTADVDHVREACAVLQPSALGDRRAALLMMDACAAARCYETNAPRVVTGALARTLERAKRAPLRSSASRLHAARVAAATPGALTTGDHSSAAPMHVAMLPVTASSVAARRDQHQLRRTRADARPMSAPAGRRPAALARRKHKERPGSAEAESPFAATDSPQPRDGFHRIAIGRTATTATTVTPIGDHPDARAKSLLDRMEAQQAQRQGRRKGTGRLFQRRQQNRGATRARVQARTVARASSPAASGASTQAAGRPASSPGLRTSPQPVRPRPRRPGTAGRKATAAAAAQVSGSSQQGPGTNSRFAQRQRAQTRALDRQFAGIRKELSVARTYKSKENAADSGVVVARLSRPHSAAPARAKSHPLTTPTCTDRPRSASPRQPMSDSPLAEPLAKTHMKWRRRAAARESGKRALPAQGAREDTNFWDSGKVSAETTDASEMAEKRRETAQQNSPANASAQDAEAMWQKMADDAARAEVAAHAAATANVVASHEQGGRSRAPWPLRLAMHRMRQLQRRAYARARESAARRTSLSASIVESSELASRDGDELAFEEKQAKLLEVEADAQAKARDKLKEDVQKEKNRLAARAKAEAKEKAQARAKDIARAKQERRKRDKRLKAKQESDAKAKQLADSEAEARVLAKARAREQLERRNAAAVANASAAAIAAMAASVAAAISARADATATQALQARNAACRVASTIAGRAADAANLAAARASETIPAAAAAAASIIAFAAADAASISAISAVQAAIRSLEAAWAQHGDKQLGTTTDTQAEAGDHAESSMNSAETNTSTARKLSFDELDHAARTHERRRSNLPADTSPSTASKRATGARFSASAQRLAANAHRRAARRQRNKRSRTSYLDNATALDKGRKDVLEYLADGLDSHDRAASPQAALVSDFSVEDLQTPATPSGAQVVRWRRRRSSEKILLQRRRHSSVCNLTMVSPHGQNLDSQGKLSSASRGAPWASEASLCACLNAADAAKCAARYALTISTRMCAVVVARAAARDAAMDSTAAASCVAAAVAALAAARANHVSKLAEFASPQATTSVYQRAQRAAQRASRRKARRNRRVHGEAQQEALRVAITTSPSKPPRKAKSPPRSIVSKTRRLKSNTSMHSTASLDGLTAINEGSQSACIGGVDGDGALFAAQYELGGIIGQGGFATVRKATHKASGDVYAVKILQTQSLDARVRALIWREVQILKTLDHPNVLHFHAAYEDTEKGLVYIVCEYMQGGELFDRILSKDIYSEQDARNVIVRLLRALVYCHDNGVVHRDIKPQNLLLESEDDDTSVKICDFGLAAKMCPTLLEDMSDRGTALRTRCGTLDYMAPEILKGNKYGPAVDVWSVGVVLYVLLTGSLPFVAATEGVLRQKILDGRVSYEQRLWSKVSESAKDCVMSMLEVHPRRRKTPAKLLATEPWLRIKFEDDGAGVPAHHLSEAVDGIRSLIARRRLRAAVNAVKGANILQRLTTMRASPKDPDAESEDSKDGTPPPQPSASGISRVKKQMRAEIRNSISAFVGGDEYFAFSKAKASAQALDNETSDLAQSPDLSAEQTRKSFTSPLGLYRAISAAKGTVDD